MKPSLAFALALLGLACGSPESRTLASDLGYVIRSQVGYDAGPPVTIGAPCDAKRPVACATDQGGSRVAAQCRSDAGIYVLLAACATCTEFPGYVGCYTSAGQFSGGYGSAGAACSTSSVVCAADRTSNTQAVLECDGGVWAAQSCDAFAAGHCRFNADAGGAAYCSIN